MDFIAIAAAVCAILCLVELVQGSRSLTTIGALIFSATYALAAIF